MRQLRASGDVSGPTPAVPSLVPELLAPAVNGDACLGAAVPPVKTTCFCDPLPPGRDPRPPRGWGSLSQGGKTVLHAGRRGCSGVPCRTARGAWSQGP